jgi:hypothetical protein
MPSVEDLTAAFRGGLGPSLAFRSIGIEEVAFREAFFELRLFTYTPVMHGLVRIEPATQHVEVEGRANWFSVVFTLLAAAFVWERPEAWPILIFLAALLGGIYKFQGTRFRRVGEFVGA